MTQPVRIGAVNYLNTKPLIYELDLLAPEAELILEVPSRLADHLADGDLDVKAVKDDPDDDKYLIAALLGRAGLWSAATTIFSI